MRIFDIIRAPKVNVKIGGWNTGKVPASAFPLTRASRLSAGSEWWWNVVEFDALGAHFRILVRCNELKEYYTAILAVDRPGGLAVICHHDLHKDHKNWHCHLVRGDIETIFVGVLRDRDSMTSWPRNQDSRCSVDYEVRKAAALGLAAARFRFVAQGELV